MTSITRRTHVSATEKCIGGMILLLLIGIAVGIYLKGQSFDASLYTVDEASLESTRNPIENKAGTLKESQASDGDMVEDGSEYGFEESYNSYGGDGESGSGDAMAHSDSSGHAALKSVERYAGFSEMGALEVYSPDTLYEKINGRAPAYHGFNFQELTFRTLGIDAMPGQYLDVFIYEMDTPVNAFGIFSLERESGAASVDFVSDGYRSDMGFFFRQGPTYVQVIASDFSDAVMSEAESFSAQLAAQIPVDDTGVGGASMLPAEHQLSSSTSYIQEYAYGLELLNDVFEARYEVDGVEFPFFAMKADEETVDAAFESVKAYYQDYGQILESSELDGIRVVVGECFGQYGIVYVSDHAIGGVMNADVLEIPKQFVEQVISNLNGAPHNP